MEQAAQRKKAVTTMIRRAKFREKLSTPQGRKEFLITSTVLGVGVALVGAAIIGIIASF